MQRQYTFRTPVLVTWARWQDWTEDALTLLSGPLLVLAELAAGVNQILGGLVLVVAPWTGAVWAILQVLGMDVQYISCARRGKQRLDAGERAAGVFWFTICGLLAIPAALATASFGYQVMDGWGDTRVMDHMGISSDDIVWMRVALVLLLIFISAITRRSAVHAALEDRDTPPPSPDRPTTRTERAFSTLTPLAGVTSGFPLSQQNGRNMENHTEDHTQARPAAHSGRGAILRLIDDTPATGRADSGRTRAQAHELWLRDTDLAADLLTTEPAMSTRELARRLTIGRVSPCHPQRAATVRRVVQPDGGAPSPADAAGVTLERSDKGA